VSAHRCRSGCQRARVKPKRARWGRVAGVEPGPGLGLERAQQGQSEHRSGRGESGRGRRPGDHANAMGEEGGGGPRADDDHGRGAGGPGLHRPQIHGWRASAVAAEGVGRAAVDVGGRDRGGGRDAEDGDGGFEYVMRLCVERS